MTELMGKKLINKSNSFYHSYYVQKLRAFFSPCGCCAIALNEHFILEMCAFDLQVKRQLPTYITQLISPGQCKKTLQNESLKSS